MPRLDAGPFRGRRAFASFHRRPFPPARVCLSSQRTLQLARITHAVRDTARAPSVGPLQGQLAYPPHESITAQLTPRSCGSRDRTIQQCALRICVGLEVPVPTRVRVSLAPAQQQDGREPSDGAQHIARRCCQGCHSPPQTAALCGVDEPLERDSPGTRTQSSLIVTRKYPPDSVSLTYRAWHSGDSSAWRLASKLERSVGGTQRTRPKPGTSSARAGWLSQS